MKRLTVHAASRTYPILVGRDVLDELGAPVRRSCGEGQVVVVSDENVAPLYLDRVRGSLTAAGLSSSQVILPAGEREKNLARAEELYGVLYDRGLRRSDTLVALGGGVVGDLAGFAAAVRCEARLSRCRRRCWHRWTVRSAARPGWTSAGKNLRRRLPPAAHRPGGHRHAGNAAAARTARRLCRGGEARACGGDRGLVRGVGSSRGGPRCGRRGQELVPGIQ